MAASCTASGASGAAGRPPSYKIIGIVLAICSGCFIGVSFVIKKTGLLKANAKYHEEAGEGYGYLKNAWWWLGMTLMIVGEICNFIAYMFADAILITPLGALTVVIAAVLSSVFLKERLSFVGKAGCLLCILGSIVIPLNAPEQSAVSTIQEMQCFVISPGFLTYAGILVVGCVIIAFWLGPKYGKKSMLVHLTVCSWMGGLSVVSTQGLGAAILSQINGRDRSQFQHWFLYVLFVFIVATLLTEIVFLNKALNVFNTALVTPTYYVYFTSATIITSAILFRGFHGTPQSIVTIVLGFLTICVGVVLLQFSKSAKDVPDSEVLKGDLDQMKAVAAQEESENEPRADTIRGSAALLRTMSTSRKKREQDEARRLRAESLEPIRENELIEWDGLRRRKTVLQPGETRAEALQRKKTFAGLAPARFTSLRSTDTDDDRNDHHAHGGLAGLRKAATLLNPSKLSMKKQRAPSDTSFISEEAANAERNADPHAYMSQARITSNQSGFTSLPDEEDDQRPHTFGLPADLQHNTAYKSPVANPSVRFNDRPTTSDGTHSVPPTPPPHAGSSDSQRSFSFLHRRGRSASESSDPPQTPKSGHSLLGFKRSGTGLDSVTEEERLGLVVGDSHDRRRSGRGGRDAEDSSEDETSSSDDFENIGLKDFAEERRRDGGPPPSGGNGGGGGGNLGFGPPLPLNAART